MSNITKLTKAILGIKKNEAINVRSFIRSWHRRLGPLFYKKKYTALDVVKAMEKAGMRSGSTVLIQSSWSEFYNCQSSPQELIQAIIDFLGPEGTLAMPCMPLLKNGEVFDVANTKTKAGYFAECFRKYPGVKRSIHARHSVCAIGKNADYLINEHHLGETPWDEKSPYYKLSLVDALVFGFGLGSHWMGTIAHCSESILRGNVDYYTNLWRKEKSTYEYIDYDGEKKKYSNFKMSSSRPTSYFKQRRIVEKYLHSHYQRISNLQISCFEAAEVVRVVTNQAKKGHTIFLYPSTRGYNFED